MSIKLERVSCSLGGQKILDHLTVDIPSEAKVICLLGLSGSGKSTLLRLFGGLILDYSGEVHINQILLSQKEQDAVNFRKKMGYVFQGYNLFNHWTLWENMVLPLQRIHAYQETEAYLRVDNLLKQFGLEEHRNKYPYQLSGGQQQRGAIARALAHQPHLLFLDEPTSALDPVMTAEVLKVILNLVKSNIKMVISTHEVSFAKKIADWVLFLDHGELVESSSAESFFQAPKSQAAIEYLRVFEMA
jgi:polar amino acid transport system ATP-binding protein